MDDPGFLATPIDPRVSQWNAARDAHTDSLHVEGKAYPPKVRARDDTGPRPHEIYNCTTCLNGEPEHPAHKLKNPDSFHVKCTKPFIAGCVTCWNDGPRLEDIGCANWERKVPIPRKGYWPGIENNGSRIY